MRLLVLLLLISVNQLSFAQALTQTVRGTVTDQVTNVPLPGVSIIITGTDPVIGTVTDIDGNFRLEKVPVGKHSFRLIMMGYEERILQNLEVFSGKELVLQIQMEEQIVKTEEVTVSAEKKKENPQNDMALASARTFSVEETQKFAAAVNDPARMAVSFAGVVSTDDGNNNISIRGNSPNGLQWRMEGLEIPNPNHFSAPGTSGGGISILSSQLLGNSDFLTGAFPSEYGNALSGVFDLKLRKGNNEKREFTLQAGFLGIDLSTEGPLKKGYNGSYLVNYRYSTLSLIQQMVDIGYGSTNFQDLAFNVNLPSGKRGSFSLFGFGGLSAQNFDAVKDSVKWKDDGGRYGSKYKANTMSTGLTHSTILTEKSWLKTSLSYSYQNLSDHTTWVEDNYQMLDRGEALSDQERITFQSVLNHKFSSRLNVRTGIVANRTSFTLEQKEYDMIQKVMIQQLDAGDAAYHLQGFASFSYRVNERFTILPGVHYLHYLLNNTQSIEPRLALRYGFMDKSSLTIGYGRHGQLQPIGVYFAMNAQGQIPNKNLEISKADHYVLSYDRMMNERLHVKVETYYQQLKDIPVGNDLSSTLSILNQQWGYITDPLVNKGEGRNYGAELTVEQFMHRNLYFLLSASLFNSEYTALDGKWRNTRFNTGHAVTFTSGKDWKVGRPEKSRTFGVNFKVIWSGGMRQSPVDIEASQLAGQTEYVESEAFTLQNPDYFRTDLKFSLKRNRLNSTHTLSLDLQNATNHRNIYGRFYDESAGKIKTYYQTPLIPVFSYKVQF